jgi:HK97 family phage major capsid protein
MSDFDYKPLSGLRRKDTVTSTPKGLNLVRAAIAQAVGGNAEAAQRYAESRWNRSAEHVKDLIVGLNTQTDGGAAMISSESGASEFFDLVRSASILGKLNFHRVPFNTRQLVATEGPFVSWRDEGAAYASSPLRMTALSGLEPFDVGALIVATMETLRDASINAELQIRNSLVKALAEALDRALLDSANSGTSDIKPAAITNGVNSNNSPLETIFDWGDQFTGDPNSAVIILNPFTAARLQTSNRPNVGAYGGTLGGWPVYTTTAVGPEEIVLIDPQHVAVAMGNASVRTSTHGSVHMIDSSSMKSADTVAGAAMVSLFSTNSVGLIGSVTANWVTTRAGAVLLFNTQSYNL